MKNSKIEWTHHTFNPWWGCVKASEGCKNCYAETLSNRFRRDVWGGNKPRQFASEKYWQEPYKWNMEAGIARERKRVFVMSMGDIFEIHKDDNIQGKMNDARYRLGDMIARTPWLDWLLLTKRPENIGLLRGMFGTGAALESIRQNRNLWIGVSVENQEAANRRIPTLLEQTRSFERFVAVRFVSIEPQLSPVNLISAEKLDWVICGGESGPHARPFNPDWARDLRDQCARYGTAFFMKQLGGHPNKRDRIEDLPEDLKIREYPNVMHENTHKEKNHECQIDERGI